MARTKKTRGPEEILKSMNENTDEKTRPYIDIKSLAAEDSELDEMDEADDVELDAEEESDPDKTTELDLSSKKKIAAKKPRAPRKKKEPAVVSEEITQVLEPKVEAAPKKEKPAAEKKAEAPKPQPKKTEIVEPVTEVVPSAPVAAHKPDHLREDVSIATASLEKTMDSMVHQWKSVKEISASITHELERVNTMLKTPAVQADPADIKEYLRQAAPRIAFANKIALGVSAAAALFSIISLSLSSSTRHRLLEQIPAPRIAYETRAPKMAEPVKQPAPEVIAPKPVEAPPAPVAAAPAPKKAEPVVVAKKVEKRPSLLSKIPLLTAPKSRARTSSLARERRAKSSSHRVR